MPSKKPRFTITLEPKTYQLISAAADEQGVTKSDLIAEFLEMAREPLERMVTLIRAAKAAPASARADLLRGFELAEKGLLPLAHSALGQADLLIDMTVRAGQATGRSERSEARPGTASPTRNGVKASRPPPANRGVTPPHQTPPPPPKVVRLSAARAARKGRGAKP